MKLLKSIVRPDKLDDVKEALGKLEIVGMTVTEVRGQGRQEGHATFYRGQEYQAALHPRVQIEIVVPDYMADVTIDAIIKAARTGKVGDGRVFVLPVQETYRIRTGSLEL